MMPSSAAASAREILTRLHDVMAGRNPAQAKLDAIVGIIAEAMNSEVCSIYLLREGVLELFATRGLAKEAVHVTKLALGEGLVGTIAEGVEVLNLDEAASHPDFAYKPETGEERYHSFAGVPRASLVVIAAVLPVFKIPESGLLLILAIDHFLDMGRTATNVVGNAVASAVIAKWEGGLDSAEPVAIADPAVPAPPRPAVDSFREIGG